MNPRTTRMSILKSPEMAVTNAALTGNEAETMPDALRSQ